jgi:hypothetical protein
VSLTAQRSWGTVRGTDARCTSDERVQCRMMLVAAGESGFDSLMPLPFMVSEAEVVEAPGCVPGGSGFESRRSPHRNRSDKSRVSGVRLARPTGVAAGTVRNLTLRMIVTSSVPSDAGLVVRASLRHGRGGKAGGSGAGVPKRIRTRGSHTKAGWARRRPCGERPFDRGCETRYRPSDRPRAATTRVAPEDCPGGIPVVESGSGISRRRALRAVPW